MGGGRSVPRMAIILTPRPGGQETEHVIVGARGGPSDIRAARGERLATARGSRRHRRSSGGHTEPLPPKAAGRKGYSRIIRFK